MFKQCICFDLSYFRQHVIDGSTKHVSKIKIFPCNICMKKYETEFLNNVVVKLTSQTLFL